MIEHPGHRLRQELQARGWTQADLAWVVGCAATKINRIIKGRAGVSPAMSKSLGSALYIDDDVFWGLQKDFDLANAKEPDPAIITRRKEVINATK